MERVVKVVKAAIRNSFRRKRPQAVQHSGNYDGPVNLPEGIAAAMRKTHSYMWLDNAVKETSTDEGALCCLLFRLGVRCLCSVVLALTILVDALRPGGHMRH